VIEFLQMGGYAPYVWSSYGITLAVLIGAAWAARRRRLTALDEARRAAGAERPRKQPTVRPL
jgi:heme exporter protein D